MIRESSRSHLNGYSILSKKHRINAVIETGMTHLPTLHVTHLNDIHPMWCSTFITSPSVSPHLQTNFN